MTPLKPKKSSVRIGGACGFWGDSALATPQLLQVPGLNYLVYDYLAETTMAILARAKSKNPELGYATDFINAVMVPHMADMLAQGVRVVSNAGGINPMACCKALEQAAQAQGLRLRVAVLTGDDVLPELGTWCQQGLCTLGADSPQPEVLHSANAYIGARGVAQALALGADVVITGRCVDSASVLGILVHEFNWSWEDWDRLSAGTLAGHLIECGAQATGGLFTDWHLVPDWANMGYPVIDVQEDGALLLSKPENTGGLIHHGAVSEQVLYEISDPGCYIMPDVVCDFREVQVRTASATQVHVSGAKGRPPTDTYKANGTWQNGYQIQIMMAIRGRDALLKAEKTAQAMLERTQNQIRTQGWEPYREVCVEYLGCEALYGPHAQPLGSREVILRIAARHANPKALAFLQREAASAGTSMGPGTRSSFSGRSDIQSVIEVFSFLVPKHALELTLQYQHEAYPVPAALSGEPIPASQAIAAAQQVSDPQALQAHPVWKQPHAGAGRRIVPLAELAWARSGDKGNDENIGVIARDPSHLPLLQEQLSAQAVHQWFAHLVKGEVYRYAVPGLHAMNFVLTHALGGGGAGSLRSDPLGKSFAQMLLDFPIELTQ